MSSVAMLYGKKASNQQTTPTSAKVADQTNIENVSASVTTLPAGSPATVSTTLSESSLDFQFGIPASITDYNQLTNRPQIEGVTLEGDKTYPELNLEPISRASIANIFNN